MKKMNYVGRGMMVVSVVVGMALATGCATRLRQPIDPTPQVSVKLSTFKSVTMQEVTISSKFAGASSNEKARRKINEILVAKMKSVFPNVKVVAADAKPEKVKQGLRIEPQIEEIKFIGGMARFWVGALAGSSAVLMKVNFVNAATGESLGAPEFYQAANAMGGAWSMGGSDNAMLSQIVQDIILYVRLSM